MQGASLSSEQLITHDRLQRWEPGAVQHPTEKLGLSESGLLSALMLRKPDRNVLRIKLRVKSDIQS